jgi:hypothetical protein
MKKFVFPGIVLLSLLLCNGCALFLVGGAAAAGAGAVYYIDGELKDTESAPLDAVHTATLAGLHDLQFAVVNDNKDALNYKILARTATDTKITIILAKQSSTVTEIRIRVGTFGDEQLSRQILDKIKAHL